MTKRFYKAAATVEVNGGFCVQLDGKVVKTPAGTELVMPTRALADAVTAEWNAQGEKVDPKSMALMPLVGTAIDRIPAVREGLIEGLLRYADTDLLCHRAAHPQDLAQRHEDMWQPLLDWAAEELGARLIPTAGVIPVKQDARAYVAFKKVMDEFDNWTLTAVAELVGISGSLVLGLAMIKGRVTLEHALVVCNVDEDHQNETWGEDDEAQQRRANIAQEITAAFHFFKVLQT